MFDVAPFTSFRVTRASVFVPLLTETANQHSPKQGHRVCDPPQLSCLIGIAWAVAPRAGGPTFPPHGDVPQFGDDWLMVYVDRRCTASHSGEGFPQLSA
jgi:hypothetical protein